MSKRSMMRFDEAQYREDAAKRDRWKAAGIGNAEPVALVRVGDAVKASKAPAKMVRDAAHRHRAHQPYFVILTSMLRPHGVSEPRTEYLFDSVRRWRFDFAWPGADAPGWHGTPLKLAIEIDGGLFVNGAHNRGMALLGQYEKDREAQLQGWMVLRYSPQQLHLAAVDVLTVFDRLPVKP